MSFFAELEYGEGRDGYGRASVNGDSYALPFGRVDNIQLLEGMNKKTSSGKSSTNCNLRGAWNCCEDVHKRKQNNAKSVQN